MGEFERYRATLSDYELLRSANCCRHAFEHQQSKIEQLEKGKQRALNLINNWWHPDVDQKLFIEELEKALRGERE